MTAEPWLRLVNGTLARCTIVTLRPNETKTFPPDSAKNAVTSVYNYGVITSADGRYKTPIAEHGGQRDREDWGDWNDDAALPAARAAAFTAGDAGAQWTCIMPKRKQLDDGMVVRRKLDVDARDVVDSLTIEPGWDAFVGSGNFVIDGVQQAEQGNYVGARDAAMVLTGSGKIILLRESAP